MKKLLLILFCLPFVFHGQVNNSCSRKEPNRVDMALNSCLLKLSTNEIFHNNRTADIAIEKIVSSVSIPNNFKLVECDNIENAAATVYRGVRYILYDNDFLNAVSERTNDFGRIFFLAHEIGHHINGHLISDINYRLISNADVKQTNAEKRKMELEADRFAGSVIARLGGSIEDATKPIRLIPNPSLNSTHPQTQDRVNAITLGFNNAKQSRLNATVVNVNNTNTVYLDRNSKDYQDIFLYLINHGKVNNKIFTGVTVTELEKIGSFSEYYNYISIFEKDVTARIKSFYLNGINYMDRIEISTGEFIERIYDRKSINENGMGVKEKITAWHNNGIKAASVTELGFGIKDGEDKRWSKQGNLLRDENYKNGKRDGWQRRWTEVEGSQFYYTYKSKEMYCDNGNKIKGFVNLGYRNEGGEVFVKDNYKCIDEVVTERYENGNPKTKHIYLNNFLQKTILYLKSGHKRMSKEWIKDIDCYTFENKRTPCFVKIWDKDNQSLVADFNFKNEIKTIKIFHANGKLKELREEGQVLSWPPSAPIKSKKCWDENGKKISCE